MTNIIQIYTTYILQLILAITLVNVWVVHFYKPTKYRGGGAKSMSEEFEAYGLPQWFMRVVGGSKIIIASLLILGFWFPVVIVPASLALSVLMIGAVAMHIKVKDPFIKAVPALVVFLMAIGLILLIVNPTIS